jgi:hypothetical protein
MTPAELEQSIAEMEAALRSATIDNVVLLENTVAEIVLRDPSASGEVRLAYQRFLENSNAELGVLRELSQNLSSLFPEGYTPQDDAATLQLTTAASETINSAVAPSLAAVLALLAAGVVMGTSPNILAQAARGKISGALLSSTIPAVNAAQRQLRRLQASNTATTAEIAAGVNTIKRLLSGVDLNGNLRSTVGNAVSEVIYDFAGAFVLAKSQVTGVDKFVYAGGVVRNSRDFCINHTGNTYTSAEIQSIWSGNWQGKRPGNPFQVRGGYNCRHYWIPETI